MPTYFLPKLNSISDVLRRSGLSLLPILYIRITCLKFVMMDYAKMYKRAMITKSNVPDPLFFKVFGSAGTGKSHIINLVSQWTEHILRSEGDNLDCPYIIRTSFTGSAASAICGQTLHSSFALNFSGACNPLDDKKRDKMRHVLRNLRVIVIDEFR